MVFSLAEHINEIQSAYDAAQASTATTGRYAAAYQLVFKLISDTNSEGDALPKEGVDPAAWVFLRGVPDVNLGAANPEGETDYSKFIREYTKSQYKLRFGENNLGDQHLDQEVQAVSDAIAQNILRDILSLNDKDKYDADKNPQHFLPNKNQIATYDASAAATILFGDSQIAGWAGNSLFIPLGHTESYTSNILHQNANEGETYDILSVIHSIKQASAAIGYSSASLLGFDVFAHIMPAAGTDVSLLWEMAQITDAQLEHAYGTGIINATFSNIILGTFGQDSLNGTSGDDISHGGAGNDVFYSSAGDDVIDGGTDTALTNPGVNKDSIHYDNAASGVTVSLDNAQQNLTTHYIGQVLKLDGVDRLYNIETITGSAQNDSFLVIAALKPGLWLDAGAGHDTFDAALASSAVTITASAVFPDRVDMEVNANGNTTTITGFERFIGSQFDDEIMGGGLRTGFAFDGNAGNDTTYGSDYGDTLLGNSGSDLLHGNNGDDVLNGGDGADVLRGNVGDDDLTGNAGPDVFAGLPYGDDRIRDFKPSEGDVIDWRTDRGASKDVMMMRQMGSDVFIYGVTPLNTPGERYLGQDSVQLKNVSLADLRFAASVDKGNVLVSTDFYRFFSGSSASNILIDKEIHA